jgi:serine/threonine protein kinase
VTIHDLVDPVYRGPDSPDPLPREFRTILGDRFRVDGAIAKARHCTVYGAFDGELGREVAIKVIEFDTEREAALTERLEQRLRSAAELGHRAVLAPTHLAVGDGFFLYVSRMASGGSAAALLRNGVRSAWEDVRSVVLDVAGALGRAHERGLVHGGLTPSNILFFSDGVARVADFGVSEALATAGLVDEAAALQASAYRPSGVRKGSPADPTADQYALAAIAYELLLGRQRLLLYGDDTIPVLDPIEVLASVPLAPGVPLHANAALRRALDPVPANRFATVTEFAAAFAGSAPAPSEGAATTPPELRLKRRMGFPVPLGWVIVGLLALIVIDPWSGATVRRGWNALWDSYSPPKLDVDVPDILSRNAHAPASTPVNEPSADERDASWFARVRSAMFGSSPVERGNAYILVAVDSGEASVTIDGVPRGDTPLLALVSAGHHVVKIAGPAAGRAPPTGVVVAAGDTARVSFRARQRR